MQALLTDLMFAHRRYYLAASLIGPAWLAALMIPPWHRNFFMSSFKNGGIYAAATILAFIATGVICSALFRSIVILTRGWKNLLVGSVLPIFCGAFCGWMMGWMIYGFSIVFNPGQKVNDGNFLLWGLAYWGFMSSYLAFYITIPMGILTQYYLKWAYWQ